MVINKKIKEIKFKLIEKIESLKNLVYIFVCFFGFD